MYNRPIKVPCKSGRLQGAFEVISPVPEPFEFARYNKVLPFIPHSFTWLKPVKPVQSNLSNYPLFHNIFFPDLYKYGFYKDYFLLSHDFFYNLDYFKFKNPHKIRNKNEFLLDMNNLVSQKSIDYKSRKEILDALKYDYSMYYNSNSNRFLKFSIDKTDYSFFIPYKFRGSKPYQKRVLWRLNHLGFNTDLKPYFLTLTVDFKRFDNIKSGSKQMSKSWNSLMTKLRFLDKDIQYLRVSEIQLKNTINIHFHILLYSALSYEQINGLLHKYNLPGYQNDLKDLRNEYIKRNNAEPYDNIALSKYVKSYILKYIKKGISSDDPLNNDNLIVLMALNSRSFSVSRNLKVVLDTPETSLTPVDFSNKTILKVPFTKSNHKFFVKLLKKPLFFIVPKLFLSLSAHKKSFLDFHKNISNGNLKFHFDGIFYGFEFPVPIYENILYTSEMLDFKGSGYLDIELIGSNPLRKLRRIGI